MSVEMKYEVAYIGTKRRKNKSYSPQTVLRSYLPKAFDNIKYYNDFKSANVKGKVVIKRIAWGSYNSARKNIQKFCKQAKLVWVCVACTNAMTKMHKIHGGDIMTFYNTLKNFKYFLWEPPEYYNPFIDKKVMLPITIYDYSNDKPIKKKDIDFLFFIDKMQYNLPKIIYLANRLIKEGYEVRVLAIESKNIKSIKKKLKCKVIVGKKPDDRGTFHNWLDKTKVFVDLSYRWTVGRTVHEALYHGALSVCTHTYASSKQVMPYYTIDTWTMNMTHAYNLCINALNSWSKKWVEECRKNARKNGYESFVKNLRETTEKLLKKK